MRYLKYRADKKYRGFEAAVFLMAKYYLLYLPLTKVISFSLL
jgi:hypothetical protein